MYNKTEIDKALLELYNDGMIKILDNGERIILSEKGKLRIDNYTKKILR